ncbi:MAG: penicillin-binding protein 2 [Propionibacteriaceae bacterium]|nr:penicillin-binding protein 2 [Propionibacteriaceae bacterium]
MNRSIRKVAVIVGLMFLALLVNLSVSYFLRTDALLNSPYNRRVQQEQFGQARGPIMAGNIAAAATTPSGDPRIPNIRVYANGPMYAPVTGYYSFIYGRSRLEQDYNAELTGTSAAQSIERVIDVIAGRQPEGAIVQTTIHPRVQQAAWDAMQGRSGGVVVIDYTTGAILAYVSTPSYDPALLSGLDYDAVEANWEALLADPDSPLSDRAGGEVYPPGSTFKLVTTAAALEAGWAADTMVDSPDRLPLPGSDHVLTNYNDLSCGGERITILKALKESCNTAYANIGMALGETALRRQAEAFGFNTVVESDIWSARSRFPSGLDPATLAMSSIGQYEVAASPLQMAMVVAAIANDGVLMEPYLVSEVRNPDLSVLSIHAKRVLKQSVTTQTARVLQEMMIANVADADGGATLLRVDGVTAGGKTGTAQSDPARPPYYWFAGFAVESHIAVAVVVERTAPGDPASASRTAGQVFKAVVEALR